MKSFIAFLKKEVFECIRSGELTFFCILFLIFGIMNPAIAKLTPWMLETLSDSLAEQGMMVTEVTVNALTSWTQFFKNIPISIVVLGTPKEWNVSRRNFTPTFFFSFLWAAAALW